jgi:hypothetical protein
MPSAEGNSAARRKSFGALREGEEGHFSSVEPHFKLESSSSGRLRRSGRAVSCYMTGVEVHRLGGTDIKLGVSADQIADRAVGHLTKLPSVEIGLEEARQGDLSTSPVEDSHIAGVS